MRIVMASEAAAALENVVDAGETEALSAQAGRVGAYAQRTVPAKDYINAMRVRKKIQIDVNETLAPYDAVVTPTRPTVAVPLDSTLDGYRLEYDRTDVAAAANLAGLPGITVPNGFGERGLPTGIAFTGRAFDDLPVIRLAHEYSKRTDHVEYTDLLTIS